MGLWVGCVALSCSTFRAADDGSASPDASGSSVGTPDASQADGTPGVDAGSDPSFCVGQSAASLLCDDFEQNSGTLKSAWRPSTKGSGGFAIGPAPNRAGRALKTEGTAADAEVEIELPFDVDMSAQGFFLDVDVFVQLGGYEYVSLVRATFNGGYAMNAGITREYGLGMQSGERLGRIFDPPNGPLVPVDFAWHHLHVEITGGHQIVTLDTTKLSETTEDLSIIDSGSVRLGIIAPITGPAQPPAVVLFDNFLARVE